MVANIGIQGISAELQGYWSLHRGGGGRVGGHGWIPDFLSSDLHTFLKATKKRSVRTVIFAHNFLPAQKV